MVCLGPRLLEAQSLCGMRFVVIKAVTQRPHWQDLRQAVVTVLYRVLLPPPSLVLQLPLYRVLLPPLLLVLLLPLLLVQQLPLLLVWSLVLLPRQLQPPRRPLRSHRQFRRLQTRSLYQRPLQSQL